MLNYESIYETKRPPFPHEHCCQEEFRKEIVENAEVFLPVTIDPSVSIGKIKIESNGEPIVVCEKDEVLEYGRSGQPPKPFLKPAKSASKDECIEAMKKRFEEEVENI